MFVFFFCLVLFFSSFFWHTYTLRHLSAQSLCPLQCSFWQITFNNTILYSFQKCLQCPWSELFISLSRLLLSFLFHFFFFLETLKFWGLLFLGPCTCSGFHGNMILQPPAVSFLILISGLLDASKNAVGLEGQPLQLISQTFNYSETTCLVASPVPLPGMRP